MPVFALQIPAPQGDAALSHGQRGLYSCSRGEQSHCQSLVRAAMRQSKGAADDGASTEHRWMDKWRFVRWGSSSRGPTDRPESHTRMRSGGGGRMNFEKKEQRSATAAAARNWPRPEHWLPLPGSRARRSGSRTCLSHFLTDVEKNEVPTTNSVVNTVY